MRILLILSVVTWHVTSSNAAATDSALAALGAVTHVINTFNNKLIKAVVENESGNLIFSPISASMGVSMVAYGARNTTRRRLSSVLRLRMGDPFNKYGMQLFVDSFNNFEQVKLYLANKIFLANNFKPKALFMKITEKIFRSKAESLDFGDTTKASKNINDWCEAKTNNRIKGLIGPDDLDDNNALVLISVVYFNGNWENPFNVNDTRPHPFYVTKSNVTKVQTMYRPGSYRCSEMRKIKAQWLELPYKSKNDSDAMSMIIILPDEIEGLAEVEKNLDELTVDVLLNTEYCDIDLWLPKFKVESTIDLQGPLSKLGLGKMFTDKANFTGIANAPPIKVTKAVQKAFIEVNEVGTEAAAASTFEMSFRLFGKEMRVDHPFLYQIIMRSSKTIIFQGRIKNIV